MKRLMMVVVMVFAGAVVGCHSAQKPMEPPRVPPEQQATAETVPPDILADGPFVVWTRPATMPDWVWKKPQNDEYLYFVGVSTPETYEIKARERAYNDAATTIARYVFTAAGYRWIDVDVGTNAKGSVMIQAIAQKSFFDNVSKSIVRKAYEVESYTRLERERQYGAWVKYYKVYVLFRWPEEQVNDMAKAAAIGAQRDLQKQYEQEVDAIKKKQLEEAMKTLEDIEKNGLDSKMDQ